MDVADLAQAQSALVEAERRLRSFLAIVPQMVWTADATGAIDWYSDRWYAYTGQTPEEAAGWGWQSVHHPEDFQRVIEEWPRCIAAGNPFEMEFRLLGRDGYRWFLTRVFPQRDERGKIVRWFGSNTDIDDRKQSEQRFLSVLQEVLRNARSPQIDPLRIDGIYLPAEPTALVGGDWYDAFALPDGRCFVSIGDVAGHGIEAASTAARLRQTVTVFALEDADPARVLERTNRVAIAQGETLATACVAVIDPRTLEMAYATAGHPAPIFAAERSCARHGVHGGLPLGAMPECGATTSTTTLTPDAHVIFYTDGLTEFARRPVDGERRLLAAIEALVEHAPEKPARWLRERVIGAAAVPDDIAVLVVAAGPRSERAAAEDRRSVWRFHSSDPVTAQRSRRSIADRLEAMCSPDALALSDSELIVGELLANTVEHAPGLVEVELEVEGSEIVLRVSDSGPGLVAGRPELPAERLAEGGRGLYLIGLLSRDMTIGRTSRGGTLVRVVLPLRLRTAA
jgi:PAS domain S-box-containing protein